ncbi:MAG TPA: ADOP family duplicated permease [Vicinamibacterales bacterium]|nr:ADOP family duplicated permease [Vicinamibacterales bacterium]
MSFVADLKFAFRSLTRAKGLALTVIVTLALGIGANAAMFSVVRGVLLRPLVNRDESRLIYIRQSAPGIPVENTTFSVPELIDLRSRLKTVTAIGDFSTIGFTMVGLGEPRVVRAGVVGGSYFTVMGLRPVRGRLIDATDDGPDAASVVVLTHRFWTTGLKSDPTVVGKTVRLGAGDRGARLATIIGILEPSVPYPTETEIIANVVSSPHHMSATMVTGRTHRMTELFGRLAPGADLEAARAELRAVHGAFLTEHPEAYLPRSDFRIDAKLLRDQITSPARTVLLVLLAASALIFVIACSNVANLILARSVRREGELAIRAALGAGAGALRRTLLAESLLLCGSGAILGVIVALWMVPVLGQYASRFSVRALDLTVDASLLWVGVGLAVSAAVLLAFVPRLPSADAASGLGLSNGSVRITSGTNRRLRLFAITQIAASFVLLAGAGMLLTTLVALQRTPTGFETRQVLAVHVPVMSDGRTPDQTVAFYQEIMRQVEQLPGVDRVSAGSSVPWRDGGFYLQFSVEGYARADGEEDPRGRPRTVSPGFFVALGVPIIAGRDFHASDRRGGESVVIVSQSVAQRMFPSVEAAVNRRLMWTDQTAIKYGGLSVEPRRIVGVVADVDDENIVPGPAMTVYTALAQSGGAGRLFVHTRTEDPYALVPSITRIVRQMSADQPVERAATLQDVRAEVLAPDRLNALVFGGFALVALTIAIVGVAGVLAFSVSARTREFGIRLALGSDPRHLLVRVLGEGAVIAGAGIIAGALAGIALTQVASGFFGVVQMPGVLPIAGAATLLVTAAILALLLPAARASRVDAVEALRSE